MRGDLTLGKPAFVRRENGRDQAPSGPDDLGVAADSIRTTDQVKNGIDAVGMIGAQRFDHVNGLAVVHLFGARDGEPRRRRRGRSR